jgi:PAS domain S-box-containing protein
VAASTPSFTAQALVHGTLLGEAAARGRAAIFLCDDSLRYVAVNDSACELLGWSREELLQLRVEDVVERPSAPLGRAVREIADGRIRSGTTNLRRRDGSSLPVQYVSIPSAVAGLPYVLTVAW